jgi:hypothetical protein
MHELPVDQSDHHIAAVDGRIEQDAYDVEHHRHQRHGG